MNPESQIRTGKWRGKMSMYFFSAGIVLIVTGLMGGIKDSLCCSALFIAGIISIVLATFILIKQRG